MHSFFVAILYVRCFSSFLVPWVMNESVSYAFAYCLSADNKRYYYYYYYYMLTLFLRLTCPLY